MLLYVLIILLTSIVYYIRRQYSYWKERDVKHDPPIPLFGNHMSIILGKETGAERYVKLYNKYSEEKYVGYYTGRVPDIIIRDPDLLKHIFSLDFIHFHARSYVTDRRFEPLMLNLFSEEGDKWKFLRQELSPAFTISKIRSMFPLVIQYAEKLQSVAEDSAINDKDVDVVDLMARFSIDIIGACVFGIEMNAINTEKSLFLELGQKIFSKTRYHLLLFALRDLFPEIKFLNTIPIHEHDIQQIILKIASIVREQRQNHALKRNDFMDILLELEAKGNVYGNSITEKDENGLPKQVEFMFDEMCLAAQLFVFFAAGYETSSTATSFTLHQLAYHPDIQYQIQDEIDRVLKKYDGKLCYDAISEMTLIEMSLKESMRIFPPGGYLTRICTKKYLVPGTNLVLEPGMKIIIPVQAIHMDPKFYENPTEFRPERFSSEAVKSRHKFVYLPFGEGPRKCIGIHLGLHESLAGLVAILQKFTVVPSPASKKQHQVKRTAYLVQAVEGALPLRLKLRS